MEDLLQAVGYHKETERICHIVTLNDVVYMISYTRDGEFLDASEVVYL